MHPLGSYQFPAILLLLALGVVQIGDAYKLETFPDATFRSSPNSLFYGNHIIDRGSALPRGPKTTVDYEVLLPGGRLQAVYFYAIAPCEELWLQIWRPLGPTGPFQLRWRQRINVTSTSDTLYKLTLEDTPQVTEQILVMEGDRMGWTYLCEQSPISMQFSDGHRYIYKAELGDAPLFGTDLTMDGVNIRGLASIGVEIRPMCSWGRFGRQCDMDCHCADNGYCNASTGVCSQGGCEPDWSGVDCQIPAGRNCPVGTFGPRCTPCHCQDNDYCDPRVGSCGDKGCAAGWTGSHCQKVDPSVANCPWGRFGSGCHRLCHCANNDYCRPQDGACTVGGCLPGWRGENCHQVDGPGCPFGRFGDNCEFICHCEANEECRPADGTCIQGTCAPGWRGTSCQIECPEGSFGKDCTETCHCRNGLTCDRVTGECSNGCADGWTGPSCITPCPRGRYGADCAGRCRCKDGGECNYISGRCPNGCDEGYEGFNCQVALTNLCEVGFFGPGCNEICHCTNNADCSVTNGTCKGDCQAGFQGPNCQSPCTWDRYGVNCKLPCNCPDGSACDSVTGECIPSCPKGFTGPRCNRACPRGNWGHLCLEICHCSDNQVCDPVSGKCPHGCRPGWQGENCKDTCPHNKWGRHCKYDCHCTNETECNRATGRCPEGCAAGWTGEDCMLPFGKDATCAVNTYGPGCIRHCHCRFSEYCRGEDGSCTKGGCAPGWEGTDCQTFCRLRWGYGCDKKCNCHGGSDCDKSTGECPNGCRSGYTGTSCQDHLPLK